jgi:hypothetical protein
MFAQFEQVTSQTVREQVVLLVHAVTTCHGIRYVTVSGPHFKHLRQVLQILRDVHAYSQSLLNDLQVIAFRHGF